MQELNNIRDWIGFASDMCVLVITIYTFYKTFIYSRLSLLQIKSYFTNTNGESHQVILLNKKMSPIVVTGVRLIIDEKYLFTFSQNEPIVIDGYSTYAFSSGDIGYIEPEIRIVGNDNVIVEITQEYKRKVYLKRDRKLWYYSKKKLETMERVICITNLYNDKIIPRNAKYVLVTNMEGKENETSFIFSSGKMTTDIVGYNGLPEEVTKTKETLENFLHEWLDQYGIKFYVKDIKKLYL